ncbi:class I SAM-dependent methyltransferase [Novosphingobium aquiterrae]|uniref:Class I SAM-dependent methyltransferase n=1 Tax=Novosphingobium aquiterrae TaxID=624388 RepID=A0ABV6PE53_9SPHN
MKAQVATRGEDLLSGGDSLRSVPRWLDRVWAGSLSRLLDRVDAGLATGSVRVRLPDGSQRVLGGRAPGFDAEADLRNGRALIRLATAGSVGCYQGYEAGEWTSPDPVALFALFCANAASLGAVARARGPWRWIGRALHRLHRNSRAGSARNIHAHYDLGNDFYAAWLDPALVYSSARFDTDHQTLADAQQAKLQSIAVRVAGAATVLEIGCGWGALSAHLRDAGMNVTAISLSDEQLAWARQHHPGIDFRKQDYRDTAGQFDAIASVEMVEAVGQEYWDAFFECLARNLKPGGRAAIQYIAIREDVFPAYAKGADFIQAYIFPGGMLVSEAAFRRLAIEHGLDWHDPVHFALDYAETLRLWRLAFDRAAAEGRLPQGFDDRFVRLWRFYLMYCEGGFRGGLINVTQVTLVKPD